MFPERNPCAARTVIGPLGSWRRQIALELRGVRRFQPHFGLITLVFSDQTVQIDQVTTLFRNLAVGGIDKYWLDVLI